MTLLTEIHRVYSAEETRELDRIAIQERGIPGITLMNRAGRAAFKVLGEMCPAVRRVSLLCGKGNNAGDGYIIAGLASQRGLETRVFQLGESASLTGDAATARDWALAQGVRPEGTKNSAELQLKYLQVPGLDSDNQEQVIVDALLGTGLKGDVQGLYREAIDAINRRAMESGAQVLSVDVPSGLSGNTGVVHGGAVRADVCVSFIGAKRGLFTAEGPQYSGQVLVDDLDVPGDIFNQVAGIPLLQWGEVASCLPERRKTTYKQACGHLLVCGGDHGMGGAVAMAAEAGLRVGTGMVTVLTRQCHVAAILARRPELMAVGMEDPGDAGDFLARANAVVVGPGLGRTDWSRALLQQAIKAQKPLLADADALNLIAAGDAPGFQRKTAGERVITPHPGEAARLLNLTSKEVEQDRFEAVQELCRRVAGVSVLKGAGTLVARASPAPAEMTLCRHGNPAMATAGMGDVLSGIIGGFMAQGLSTWDATRVGVALHSYASDRWVMNQGGRGFIATDMLEEMRKVLNE